MLWEGEPLRVPGALAGGASAPPGASSTSPWRAASLRERTGAVAVDMESAVLAATGRLAGVVRAISDTPERPVGRLAHAARPTGAATWRVVARAVARRARATLRAASAARRALASLRARRRRARPEAAP